MYTYIYIYIYICTYIYNITSLSPYIYTYIYIYIIVIQTIIMIIIRASPFFISCPWCHVGPLPSAWSRSRTLSLIITSDLETNEIDSRYDFTVARIPAPGHVLRCGC